MPELAQVQMFARDLFRLNFRIIRNRFPEGEAVRIASAIEAAFVSEVKHIAAAKAHAETFVALTPAPR